MKIKNRFQNIINNKSFAEYLKYGAKCFLWSMAVVIFMIILVGVIYEDSDRDPSLDKSVVNWEYYDSLVKTRIEEMGKAGNCDALQKEFNAAYTNDNAQRARTGEGNSKLMNYIEELRTNINCSS